MWTLLLVVFTSGSPALLQAAPVQGSSGRSSIASVFHVEGTSRYSLTFQQASESCQSLGYKLATQEQVKDAFKTGLRTCRYGWIDGQNVMFLPHVNGPNCDSSSTDITFRPEAADYLSDVYCFNPSDALLNSDDTGKSNSEGLTNGNTASANEKSHDDILTEVETEGFLVDLEEIMGGVKRETSVLNDMEVPSTDVKPSAAPALEEPSVTTHNEDSKGPTSKPSFGKSSSTVTPSVLFFDSEGSGSASDIETLFAAPEPSQFTTTEIVTKSAKGISMSENIKERPINPKRRQNVDIGMEGTSNVEEVNPSPNVRKDDGPSTWLIIFAFCVVVGAVVCILAAIATRDKWYGPRESRNITTEVHNKDYSKTETLPLSDKEQEIVALMRIEKLNGKTDGITATSLDEHEKEYLM
ncbi:versican core protein [Puntigrus tetrazona]|uniref:versican core protein n=1 Tax=Puntigrus tetrazona TaxID=1606681 RepID=UPI001C8AADB6|nr:versican core protein [Puntigrus tetrazona]